MKQFLMVSALVLASGSAAVAQSKEACQVAVQDLRGQVLEHYDYVPDAHSQTIILKTVSFVVGLDSDGSDQVSAVVTPTGTPAPTLNGSGSKANFALMLTDGAGLKTRTVSVFCGDSPLLHGGVSR